MFCERYDEFVKALEKRRFLVHSAATAAEAKELGISLIGGGSVGFGGSVTVTELGLYETLQENGNAVYWHWKSDDPGKAQASAAHADWFVCSTNAVTRDGRLVNIDGTGNRVAGMFAGPKKVILFIGKNKLVEGGLDEAIARIKRVACPANGRRLNTNTPCTLTGECTDCASPRRMCKITSIIEYPPNLLSELHLVLIDEELGY